ncbi:hypothetical protein AOY93_01485 [Escherichia coli]|nr:hypothetical protein AOY93_01485 [Escherichia coli]
MKTLDVCNYDSERQVLTSHHGIIRDEEKMLLSRCFAGSI